MSGGIKLQINGHAPNVVSTFEPVTAAGVQLPELPFLKGEANGAIFFNLEWQTRRAGDLRQNLFTFFQTPNESNQIEDSTNAAWRNLINAARDHEDFTEFRRQPENFWRRVRQFSEPQVLRDADGRETQTASRFDELLATIKAKNISPRELAESLPPPEREVFNARLRLEKTFGTQIFNEDDGTPDETQQTRFREISAVAQNAAESSEIAQKFLRSGEMARGETAFSEKNAPLPRENAAVLQNSRNAAVESNSALAREKQTLPSSSSPPAAASQNLKTGGFGNPILQTAPPPAASPAASNNSSGAPILSESFAARVSINAVAENPPNNTPGKSRGDKTIVGGALINGAFAAIENHQNLRDDRVGDARANADFFDADGDESAAGATGALFGAAVGTIVSSAEIAVGGVLGFVSGLAVGVDVQRGLRWLGAGGESFNAVGAAPAGDQKSLAVGNSFAPNSNFQLVPA